MVGRNKSATRHPRPLLRKEGSQFQSSPPCRPRRPETMKMARRRIAVARASRPLWRERLAPARGQDARTTAGETPALPFSKQSQMPVRWRAPANDEIGLPSLVKEGTGGGWP